MSDLTNLLGEGLEKSLVEGLSSQTGQSKSNTSNLLNMAMPVMIQAIQRNAATPKGASGLMEALNNNHDGSTLDNLEAVYSKATSAVEEDGNNIIDYTLLNFVAIEFYGRGGSGVQPIDASEMTHMHIDVRVNENVDPTDFFRIEVFNNFTLGNSVSGAYTIPGTDLVSNDWAQFDIPLSDFAGLSAKDALGAIIFVSDATIANVSLDNIYFYAEN